MQLARFCRTRSRLGWMSRTELSAATDIILVNLDTFVRINNIHLKIASYPDRIEVDYVSKPSPSTIH